MRMLSDSAEQHGGQRPSAVATRCSLNRAYTQGDRRRDDRRDSRPVYTLQAIVAATNTCLIEQPTGDCRRDDRL